MLTQLLRRRRSDSAEKAKLGRGWVEPLEGRMMLAADVLTHHNDNASTGVNANETVLTTANVQAGQFGRLFSQRVDGAVFAQPLIKRGVSIPGKGVHDVMFVATEHDSVYAFDANNRAGRNKQPLWKRSFINPGAGVRTLTADDTGALLVGEEAGITGTPVIDPATNTLYVVAATREVIRGRVRYVQRLHALNIRNGAEKFGGPVVISAAVPGTGEGSQNGVVRFSALRNLQRSALSLVNGVVYIAWSSHSDIGPYHGWVMGYNARTLQQTGALSITPNGTQGGVWMSGGKVSADASGNLFLTTGNGTFTADAGGSDFGDSVLKLSTTGGLSVLDWFTPFNQAQLSATDLDLGSTGVLLLPDLPGPHPHEAIVGDKSGTIYLLDRDNLGRFNASGDQIIQRIDNALPGGVYGQFTYFNGRVYIANPNSTLKAYELNADGTLNPTPVSEAATFFGYPGATVSISSNGGSEGIVWAIQNGQPATLHAYDAANLGTELYAGTAKGQLAGNGTTFAVPTVANGKVYVGARGKVTVYGLL